MPTSRALAFRRRIAYFARAVRVSVPSSWLALVSDEYNLSSKSKKLFCKRIERIERILLLFYPLYSKNPLTKSFWVAARAL